MKEKGGFIVDLKIEDSNFRKIFDYKAKVPTIAELIELLELKFGRR